MKRMCNTLAVILLIAGIIGGIIVSNQLGFASSIGVFVSAIILPIILFAIGEALQKLDEIKATVEDVLPGLKNLTKNAKEKEILADGGWICPKCGTVNHFYTNGCKCGQRKDEAQKN